jgi:hypothetical protein
MQSLLELHSHNNSIHIYLLKHIFSTNLLKMFFSSNSTQQFLNGMLPNLKSKGVNAIWIGLNGRLINEPRHDKTNIVRLQPAWIKTSLRIRAVWLGSMLFAISFCTCSRVGKRTAWILIRLRGCGGWSGSMLVANALCWVCRDAAQILAAGIVTPV